MPKSPNGTRGRAKFGISRCLCNPRIIRANDALTGSFFQIFEDWLEWHSPPFHLQSVLLVRWNKRRKIRTSHQFKAVLLQGGVVAPVVPHLVKDGARQKVRDRRIVVRPTHVFPTEPVTDL